MVDPDFTRAANCSNDVATPCARARVGTRTAKQATNTIPSRTVMDALPSRICEKAAAEGSLIDIGRCDPLLSTRRVEQHCTVLLANDEGIADLPDGHLDVARRRRRLSEVRAFVARFRLQDLDRLRRTPSLPIGAEGDRRQQDALRSVADGGEEDLQPHASTDQRDVTNTSRVRRITKRIGPDLESLERILRARELTEATDAVEEAVVLKDAKVTQLRDRLAHAEVHAVGGHGRLRELAVALLPRPRARLGQRARPPLAVGPPAVYPQDDAPAIVIDEHLRRRHVREEIVERPARIGLRTEDRGVAHVEHTGLVDLPRTADAVRKREPDERPHVIGEVHVVAAERTLDPVGNPNDRRS